MELYGKFHGPEKGYARCKILLVKKVVFFLYSKTCLKRLNAGQKYCRMLQGEHSLILSTSLSYHLSLRPLFCLFLSNRLRQVLLYLNIEFLFYFSNVIELRNKHKDNFLKKHGVKLSFMSAFIKASAWALQDQPVVNAVIDDLEIVYRDYIDISVAVATPKVSVKWNQWS